MQAGCHVRQKSVSAHEHNAEGVGQFHAVDGRTYVYHAAEPRARVAARAVQRVVDWFCNGSIEEVLVGMVDTAMLDQKQVRMLADKVAKTKAKGAKK